MNPDSEIRRLLDVLPASGRMKTTLVSKPQQLTVLNYPSPRPWVRHQLIWINFSLWQRLSQPQRDLLMLRTVSWLTARNWFKPDIYQGLALAGVLGVGLEAFQGEGVGLIAASGLSAIAAAQVWRNSRSLRLELEADETAVRIAQRRGYTETEAAQHLFSAINAIAKIEGHSSLEFNELIRSQNLRALAGLSKAKVPENFRSDL